MAAAVPPQPGVIKKLDEVVVNRIAAGEVIQRPANALKEMLENSLDAKSNQITVTVKAGGLKMLQIADNGTGIRQDDLGIVAERFTTSKLRDFKDLNNISTYGFRGEALASISHVARLTILTKTRESKCGFKAEYSDGKLVGAPKPTAANQGTTITVEDLFFNVPNRLAALRSSAEEFNKISEVMTRYAIHNSGVGFTLKKAGETGVTVKTMPANSILDNIRCLYGPSVAKELIEFEFENERYKVKSKGYITNVNYSVKKFTFLLFINHRLVDSGALRKSIENVYASYLPKGMSPFVYLSLEIDPANVDVNVHPTKHEVFFLHQDSIIEKFQQALEQKLLNSNASRTFYTDRLLPESRGAKIDFQIPSSSGGEKTTAPKDMIRTSSTDQKLDKFFMTTPKESSTNTINPTPGVGAQSKNESENGKISCADSEFRECKLTSVKTLRKQFQAEGSQVAREMFANHTFVGCVNRKLGLFQHATKLYLVNTHTASIQLFKQLLLRDFGNIGVIKLNPAPSLKELALLGLENPEAGWSPDDGDKTELADFVISTLFKHREMLDDYFSLQMDYVDGVESVIGLPLLLDDYCPWLAGLPLYILRLATEVDYTDEVECFRGFIQETARFYAVPCKSGARMDLDQHKSQSKSSTSDDQIKDSEEEGWKFTIEHVLYPAFKKILLPSQACLTDRSLLQIANLPDLYKVFERC